MRIRGSMIPNDGVGSWSFACMIAALLSVSGALDFFWPTSVFSSVF